MPEDPKTLAEEYFFKNKGATFKDTADALDLSYETVRDWGDKGRWYYRRLKQSSALELPDSIQQQAEIIRAVLVKQIATEHMDAEQVSDLVDAWRSLVSIGVVQQESSFDRDSLLDEINED